MGMNHDTGEIRSFAKPEDIPQGWTPVSHDEVKRLAPLPPQERPPVLEKWRAKKARRHERAVARGKNRG